jgi:16S rRNA (guanine527-N7)-methyltransferase
MLSTSANKVDGDMQDFVGLEEAARKLLDRDLTQKHIEAFAWYSSELREWNNRFNLTAITDPEGIEVRHFLDSLTCLLAIGAFSGERVVDLGTGAGFPGLPLKILCPNLNLTLVEATKKKADFCRHIVEGLKLESVTVVHARAEEHGRDQDFRQSYDVAVARAVAPMPVLIEYLLPLLHVGGIAIAQKGETAHAEAQAVEGAIGILGGRVDRLIPVELPGVAETRYLVVIKKVAATPEKYPRRPGIPEKRPLRG